MTKTTDITAEDQLAKMSALDIKPLMNGAEAARLQETFETGKFRRVGLHDGNYGSSKWSVEPDGIFGKLREELGPAMPQLNRTFSTAATPESLITNTPSPAPAYAPKPDFTS